MKVQKMRNWRVDYFIKSLCLLSVVFGVRPAVDSFFSRLFF